MLLCLNDAPAGSGSSCGNLDLGRCSSIGRSPSRCTVRSTAAMLLTVPRRKAGTVPDPSPALTNETITLTVVRLLGSKSASTQIGVVSPEFRALSEPPQSQMLHVTGAPVASYSRKNFKLTLGSLPSSEEARRFWARWMAALSDSSVDCGHMKAASKSKQADVCMMKLDTATSHRSVTLGAETSNTQVAPPQASCR